MSDIADVNTAHKDIERRDLKCEHCGGTWSSPSAAAFCCVSDADDGRGRE